MQENRSQICQQQEFALLGPPHPGEVFRDDVLPKLALSRADFAEQLGVSRSSASAFLAGKRRVSAKMAQKLAAIAGPSVLYWLMLQAHYDAWSLEMTGQERSRRSQSYHRSSLSSQTTRLSKN